LKSKWSGVLTGSHRLTGLAAAGIEILEAMLG
jgi:hypothetical protein